MVLTTHKAIQPFPNTHHTRTRLARYLMPLAARLALWLLVKAFHLSRGASYTRAEVLGERNSLSGFKAMWRLGLTTVWRSESFSGILSTCVVRWLFRSLHSKIQVICRVEKYTYRKVYMYQDDPSYFRLLLRAQQNNKAWQAWLPRTSSS